MPVVAAPSAERVAIVRGYPDARWAATGPDESGEAPTRGVEAVAEGGAVLAFPRLAFALCAGEARFLDPRWADGRGRGVSLRWPSGELRGAKGGAADLAELRWMMMRYAAQSEALVRRLFPRYGARLARGGTSFGPLRVDGAAGNWRHDDTRLHVDAAAARPTRGLRLLRVFCNVSQSGEPRRWRLGEDFESHARRFLASMHRPLPGSAWLLERLHVTRRRRSEYDHYMLRLHDIAKADAAFQRDSPQAEVDFAAGTTWVAYTDQVLHAAMGGQHLLEQTFLVPPEALLEPRSSPLAVLERLTGRRLADGSGAPD